MEARDRFTESLRLYAPGTEALVYVERCAAGRLQNSYPAGAHDVGVRIETGIKGSELASLLEALVYAICTAEAQCRRIVYIVDAGNIERITQAESAGFRYVLDVDVQNLELSLMVAEPEWATATDMDLDRVPGT
ncbi:hypothetical protein ACFWC5_16750 [Streptomyces sp. NPDC060085]|uniref:hypothetical protein n=1 Tax=Streptomyces sp. NPDC060085 TaxID=3347054 RepID=UPI00365938E7